MSRSSKTHNFFEQLRQEMVQLQLAPRGIRSQAVLEAMGRVPRERFIPENLAELAYEDGPLPIGEGQTISQPYIVAVMSELAEVRPGDRALEIGTGCGYAAAVLAEMGVEVYTIERIASLAQSAQLHLSDYPNAHVRIGDGSLGWPEEAPFDAILVTCATPEVPQALLDQLKVGGRIVIPVGDDFMQALTRLRKREDGSFEEERLEGVRFVPLISGKS